MHGTASKLLTLRGIHKQQVRVVVRITEALRPEKYTLHKEYPPAAATDSARPTVKEVKDGDGFTRWDVAHLRLLSDHRPFTGAANACDPHVSSAYTDGDFFEQLILPPRVVRLGESS